MSDNPHKKGEHVFNDIAGSVGNAFAAALELRRAKSLTLSGPHGRLRLSDLPRTSSAIDHLRRDSILIEGRTVVAPASGIVADTNSGLYGRARLDLERELSGLVVQTATLIWRRKPRSNSSFHEFEASVSGMHDTRSSIAASKSSFRDLVAAAHDPEAEKAALAENVSETERNRRMSAISRMHQHRVTLQRTGSELIDIFSNELDVVLERRIAGS